VTSKISRSQQFALRLFYIVLLYTSKYSKYNFWASSSTTITTCTEWDCTGKKVHVSTIRQCLIALIIIIRTYRTTGWTIYNTRMYVSTPFYAGSWRDAQNETWLWYLQANFSFNESVTEKFKHDAHGLLLNRGHNIGNKIWIRFVIATHPPRHILL